MEIRSFPRADFGLFFGRAGKNSGLQGCPIDMFVTLSNSFLGDLDLTFRKEMGKLEELGCVSLLGCEEPFAVLSFYAAPEFMLGFSYPEAI